MTAIPNAKRVCEQRYADSKTPCHGCPIHKQCIDEGGYMLTWENHQRWQERIEAAAVEVLAAG